MKRKNEELTDRTLKNLKPGSTAYKKADGKGMYVYVSPTGVKSFRMKYRIGGKEKIIVLGKYPEVSLKEARSGNNPGQLSRDEVRSLVERGIDPMAAKRAKKRTISGADSFEAIAREWYEKFKPTLKASYSERLIHRLEHYVFARIRSRPIHEITPPEFLNEVLRRIEARDKIETAHRIKQICGQVFRYAIATGRAERDITADLRGAMPPAKEKHLAAFTTEKEVGELIRAIHGYQGSAVVCCALKLAALTALRPGELRNLEWAWINFDKAVITLPAEVMKMKRPHAVPLSRQALEVLDELRPLTGNGKYVFPSPRTSTRPISDNGVLAALRRMGFTSAEMCGHGFRTVFSTLANESGKWNPDAIEAQLAHGQRSAVRAAYNRGDYFDERVKMMQWYADLLDKLRDNLNVLQFPASGA